MNHWFLCVRDVMWFLIAIFPLIGAESAGKLSIKGNDLEGLTVKLAAYLSQGLLLLLVYLLGSHGGRL